MFSKTQSEYLLRRLQRNEVVLFLGAGFATEATNKNNEKLPTGHQLSEKIWKYLGMPDSFDGTPLTTMYDLLLNKGKKTSEIKNFLESTFIVKDFPEYYKNLTIPFWLKIYTTNIDNLLESIYKFSDQRPSILKYPKDEYKEIDRSLEFIPIIYLNGKIPCEPNELIFSRKQYAKSTNNFQPLYHQFINDYSTTTTIFIGTSIDEPVFEQYIAARETRRTGISEHRPQCFLIDRHISPAREPLLRDLYNIEPIKASTEEFLEWIRYNSDELYDRLETLKIIHPTLWQIYEKSTEKNISALKEYFIDFSQGFSKVNPSQKIKQKNKNYLLGFSPSWDDIFNNLDAPRHITKDIYEYIEDSIKSKSGKINIVTLLGSAGSGKSTILKRLALQLAQNGRTVFISYSEYIPDYISIVKTIDSMNQKILLFFDNADLMLTQLPSLIEELNKCQVPPLILLSTRTNAFDRITSKFAPIENIKEFKTQNLDRDEIIELLKILDENNLLGQLKGLSQENRIKEFEYRAKKQILVAMREATKGDNFDNIIKSEFQEIVPPEVRFLTACISLTTEAGFTISKQDLIEISDLSPAETLYFLERNLRDVVIKAGPKEDRLLLRHRTIAEYIINNCLDLEKLKQVYLRILTSLAPEINIYDWKSRKFSLYREIINHYTVYRRFSQDISKARELYESLIPFFNMDYHFWLQYGSLELEGAGGNLDLAENYLLQAESIKPKNIYVKNALANLYFKKSIATRSNAEAITHKETANEILNEIFEDPYYDDPYTYHIYCKGNYSYLIEWVKDLEVLKREFEFLKKKINEGMKKHPLNKRLQNVSDIITRAYLLTTTKDKIDFPVIPNDFD